MIETIIDEHIIKLYKNRIIVNMYYDARIKHISFFGDITNKRETFKRIIFETPAMYNIKIYYMPYPGVDGLVIYVSNSSGGIFELRLYNSSIISNGNISNSDNEEYEDTNDEETNDEDTNNEDTNNEDTNEDDTSDEDLFE